MVAKAVTHLFERQFLEKRNPFLFLYGVKLIYAALVGAFITLFEPPAMETPLDGLPSWYRFTVLVIVAPLLETLICQVLIIEVLRYFKVKHLYVILISALLFSVSHNHHIFFVFSTFIPGVIYAMYYIKLRQNNGWIHSAAFVFFLHSLYNLSVFLMTLL